MPVISTRIIGLSIRASSSAVAIPSLKRMAIFQRIEGSGAGAEVPRARRRPALEPLEQLFDVDPGDGAVSCQGRRAVERLRQRKGLDPVASRTKAEVPRPLRRLMPNSSSRSWPDRHL